jgi:hypothetical protein
MNHFVCEECQREINPTEANSTGVDDIGGRAGATRYLPIVRGGFRHSFDMENSSLTSVIDVTT